MSDANYTPPAFPGTPQAMAAALEWLRTEAMAGEPSAALLLQALVQNTAMGDVVFERCRQIHVEGWNYEHDDEHPAGELALAGSCYAANAARAALNGDNDTEWMAKPTRWPWDPKWWKPKNVRRDLVRAAALIVAEIEKLDRQAAKVTA